MANCSDCPARQPSTQTHVCRTKAGEGWGWCSSVCVWFVKNNARAVAFQYRQMQAIGKELLKKKKSWQCLVGHMWISFFPCKYSVSSEPTGFRQSALCGRGVFSRVRAALVTGVHITLSEIASLAFRGTKPPDVFSYTLEVILLLLMFNALQSFLTAFVDMPAKSVLMLGLTSVWQVIRCWEVWSRQEHRQTSPFTKDVPPFLCHYLNFKGFFR